MTSVLIVDDAAFMRLAIKNVLTKNGFSVVAEAQNGREAVEKYMEHKPDIVTMDITMPDMTGIEALNRFGLRSAGKDCYDFCHGAGKHGQSHFKRGKIFIVKPYERALRR